MNEITTAEHNALTQPEFYKPSALMDPERFQHLATVARVMADSSLMPETLRGSSPQQAYANAFMVVNVSDRWNADPFLVAQAASVVHGKLMLEGKLVAAILQRNLGITLDYDYIRDGKDVIVGIKVSGKRRSDGKVVSIDGTIDGWATKGKDGSTLKQWKLPQAATQLIYRGTREWARVYEPGAMLGITTDDEYDPAYNAKDITPPPSGGSGQSVIDRLKAQKSDATAGFDHDRVQNDLKSAVPTRGEEDAVGDSASSSEAGDPRESAPASHVSNRGAGSASQADHAEEEGAGLASSLPSDPIDEQDWLLNVAGMLWAATNFNGDPDLLKAQRKAAAASYPTDGRSEKVLAKAKAVFDRCATVVSGECPPEDGLAIVAGIVGVEEKVLSERARKAGA